MLMKKFLFVLLTAALALPMTAQVKGQVSGDYKTGTPNLTMKHHAKMVVANRDEVPAGYASITLATDDVWGDGSGYQMLLDADATAFGTIIPETGPLTTSGDAPASVYAEFEYKIPENADGSLNTANIVLADAVTILIPAGVYDWCITNPTPGDRMWIASENGSIGGRYNDYEFADGGIYTFYVSLGGSNDQVDLDIYDPTAPEMPVNVTADENGNIGWENDHDPAFNLRYRPYDPNTAVDLFWGFETDDELEGWMVMDADGDGYGWYIDDSGSYANSGMSSIFSFSYYGGVGATSPDNYLISPEVPLGGTLKFWARNHSDYFPEQIEVGVMINDEYTPLTDLLQPTTTYEEYTVEIPDMRGVGSFVFHHYGTTDEWAIYIDDVTYSIPGNEPGEWIVVEGIEGNEYTIEGLEDGVTYEVQVQAVGVDGRTTDWTPSTLFTYEAGEVPQPTEKTGAPVFNGYTTDGIHAYFIEIQESEPSTIYFRVQYGQDGEFTEWAEYEDILSFTQDGWYRIEAYAVAQGKLPSDPIAYEFIVNPATGLSEMTGSKTVAGVRYFNAMGQEMQEANGLTIVVTTYTDGTTSTAKVMK